MTPRLFPPAKDHLGSIDPATVAAVRERIFSLNPVWDRLIADGRLGSVVHPGGRVDVGRPEGIALAGAKLA